MLKLLLSLTIILMMTLTSTGVYAKKHTYTKAKTTHSHVSRKKHAIMKKRKTAPARVKKIKPVDLDGLSSLALIKMENRVKQECKKKRKACLKVYGVTQARLQAERREAIQPTVVKMAKEYDVPPRLILAIANVESKYRKRAENGPNKGLMMVNMHYHAKKFHGASPFNVAKNIAVGTSILKKCLDIHNDVINDALVCYNGGGDPNYVPKVRAKLASLKKAT